MLVFAEAAPPGTEGWLAIYAYLMAGVGSTMFVIRHLKKKEAAQTVIADQPLHIRATEEYVTRREHDELKKDVRELKAENRALFADQSRESREGLNGVHERITTLQSAFSRLSGSIESYFTHSKISS